MSSFVQQTLQDPKAVHLLPVRQKKEANPRTKEAGTNSV